MHKDRQDIIERVFNNRNENGLWKVIPESHKYFPHCLHYVPNYKASLWALLLLGEIGCDRNDERVKQPLEIIKDHFFDDENGLYSLKEDHFPIPCLNGNLLYLDGYFNEGRDEKSLRLLDFFYKYQRFDDGKYLVPKNKFCTNRSCFGKHTCYWGVVKLLKGISFIPGDKRNEKIEALKDKCINFVLKHRVCFSSRKPETIMISKMDMLTFPNFYKSDFLEILWLMKRDGIHSEKLLPALELLKSKKSADGRWRLERTMNNMVTSIGQVQQFNPFVSQRAKEVLDYYEKTT